MLVDSHCHINCLKGSEDKQVISHYLTNARERGVDRFLCVSIDWETWPEVMAIAEDHHEVYASIGVHPNHHGGHEPSIDELLEKAKHPKVIAIGETGLDYFHSKGDLSWQQNRFRTHIAAAKQCAKPLIIHTREARDDTIRMMQEESASEAGGIMHCFTETWDMAKAAMDMGFYISFSGIVTFKSATELQDVAKKMPLDRMLVETDSPYLAPVPHRGKQNEPAYTRYVAEFIAQLRGTSYEAIAKATTANFHTLFKDAG